MATARYQRNWALDEDEDTQQIVDQLESRGILIWDYYIDGNEIVVEIVKDPS